MGCRLLTLEAVPQARRAESRPEFNSSILNNAGNRPVSAGKQHFRGVSRHGARFRRGKWHALCEVVPTPEWTGARSSFTGGSQLRKPVTLSIKGLRHSDAESIEKKYSPGPDTAALRFMPASRKHEIAIATMMI